MSRRRAASKHTITDDDDFDFDDWEQMKAPKKKRTKGTAAADIVKDDGPFSMQSLLDSVSYHSLSQGTSASHWHPLKRVKHNEAGGSANIRGSIKRGAVKEEEVFGEEGGVVDFETLLEPELEEMKSTRKRWREESAESAMQGCRHRPLSMMELSHIAQSLRTEGATQELSSYERLLMKRIELSKLRRLASLPTPSLTFPPSPSPSPSLTPLQPSRTHPPPHPSVLSALSSIGTTPFSSSLLSRLVGPLRDDYPEDGYLMRDWRGAKRALWCEVMEDVRGWHELMYPEREQEEHFPSPIDYVFLQPDHLDQIHELLGRIFWPGIDISDSLRFSPSKCTVVALYRRLVVGAAFMSSPEETYITYLVVRPGWESAGIATKMLYSLLTRNPSKDIILHVSANNPAMLLYNRFGFKAEEFIVGFYEQYLDRNSRQSKNAFRLRLRR